MKDEEVKKAVQSDEDAKTAENGEVVDMDGDATHAVNANGKSRTKPHRKRRGSTSPEEDIIDGFAISSYSSLEALESRGPSKPELHGDTRRSHKSSKRGLENGINGKKRKSEKRRARMHLDPKPKDSDSEEEANVERKKPEGSRLAPQREKQVGNTSDDNSDSASSDKGYWCDTESEGERMSENESAVTTSAQSGTLLNKTSVATSKPASGESSDKEAEKSTSKPSEWPSSSTVTSQRPSSRSTSTSASLHLALSSTATTASHPMTPTFGHPHHSSLFPHFPSFHAHPGALGGYSHGPAGESPFPYPSPELLRHELNNRFLQSHADRVPPGLSASQLMHYESHQHHHQHLHQHQHQHFHSNGTPVITPQAPQSVLGVSPGGSYFAPQSPVPPPLIQKKPGKWCATHVQIAWQIYYHQQKVQAELHKDPHVKPEQVSISRSGGCLSLSTRPSTHDALYPVHGGPGTVSPVAAPPIPGGAGPFLPGAPIPTAHGSSHGLAAPFSGGSMGLGSATSPSMMGLGGSPVGGLRSGLGASISSPFRRTASSSLTGSSLGLGSSYGVTHGINRDWGRVPGWLSRETEREKDREHERGRERERELERERERDRSRDHDQDRDKERGRLESPHRVGNLLSSKPSERERSAVHVSDEESDKQRDREKPAEARRSPSSRPTHSTGFNIASLTSTDPKRETSPSSQEIRGSLERTSSTSASFSSIISGSRRDELPKLSSERRLTDEHELVVLSSDRHSGVLGNPHGIFTSFMDKRNIYEERERADLARLAAHPPMARRIGGYPPPHLHPHPYSLPHSHTHPHIPPPSTFFAPGSLSSHPYLSGSAMSAVTHPPGIPGFLPPRGMLGLPLPGMRPRSRSPGDAVGSEHVRTTDILLAAPDRP